MSSPILYLCQASNNRFKRYRESHKSEINQRNINKKNQRKQEIFVVESTRLRSVMPFETNANISMQ